MNKRRYFLLTATIIVTVLAAIHLASATPVTPGWIALLTTWGVALIAMWLLEWRIVVNQRRINQADSERY